MTYQRADIAPLRETLYGIGFHWTAASMPRQGEPVAFEDAVDAFERSGVIRGAIGPAAEYLIRAKRAEIEEFDRTVTNWERLQYLDG